MCIHSLAFLFFISSQTLHLQTLAGGDHQVSIHSHWQKKKILYHWCQSGVGWSASRKSRRVKYLKYAAGSFTCWLETVHFALKQLNFNKKLFALIYCVCYMFFCAGLLLEGIHANAETPKSDISQDLGCSYIPSSQNLCAVAQDNLCYSYV